MEAIVDILVDWGYIGLFLAAFVAGSILPFSSELVLSALIGMDADPTLCIISASVGNTLGGALCYWLGYVGNLEKIEKWIGINQQKMDKFADCVQRRGAWIGFLGFLPWVGEVILVLLGLMRSNFWVTTFFMFLGKLLRYVVWYLGTLGVINLF